MTSATAAALVLEQYTAHIASFVLCIWADLRTEALNAPTRGGTRWSQLRAWRPLVTRR